MRGLYESGDHLHVTMHTLQCDNANVFVLLAHYNGYENTEDTIVGVFTSFDGALASARDIKLRARQSDYTLVIEKLKLNTAADINLAAEHPSVYTSEISIEIHI